MSSRGWKIAPHGSLLRCRSVVNRDTDWSMRIYPATNSFYDFSSGSGGSVIDLVMLMEGVDLSTALQILSDEKYTPFQANYKKSKPIAQRQFEYTRYLTTDKNMIAAIHGYAASRGWHNGYETGFFPVCDEDGKWREEPSVMFLHRDIVGNIVGAKFRKISNNQYKDKDNGARFSSRGKMEYFILEYIDPENYGEPTLYIVEGEGNAISLWQYCQDTKRNCVVVSFGGVSNFPDKLPPKYSELKEKKLIIDYDGDERNYLSRIQRYTDRYDGLSPVKIKLDKGVDINKLYLDGNLNFLNTLI